MSTSTIPLDPASVRDFVQEHPDRLAEVAKLIDRNGSTRANGDSAADDTGDRPDKKPAAGVLVDIAEELYRFGISDSGEPFAVPRSGPQVVFLLRGGRMSLRAQLARLYRERTGKTASQSALADALLVVEGIAQDADPERLHLRVAQHNGDLWLDLGDHTGRAVAITDTGWTVEDTPPVLFKRTPLTGALPEPVTGGATDLLWRWLNITPADRRLAVAYLVATMFEDIPHPILGLFSEQGNGKTTAAKVLVLTVDPGPAPTRKPPRDAESWVTAAAGSWVCALDNISAIPEWLSDSLCRAVTGDGHVVRKLYTDGDQYVVAFRRCLILTGIALEAVRGDLADRLLPLDLDRIDEGARLEEREMWPAWEQDHPRILGAVLDLAAAVKRALPSVELDHKPRMADFARILHAVDQVLGTAGLEEDGVTTNGLTRYLQKQGTLAAETLGADPFVSRLADVFADKFVGTSAELLELVTPTDDGWRPPKGWPGNARAVTVLLHRQGPPMRKAGWTVEHDDGANHSKVTRWTIARPENPCNEDPRDPQDPRPGSDPSGDNAGHAGHAGHESAPSPHEMFEAEELSTAELDQ